MSSGLRVPGHPSLHAACGPFRRRWIVRADPEAGLEMFTEMRPPLAPEAVLPILTAEVPQLCAPYLEAALKVGSRAACAPPLHVAVSVTLVSALCFHACSTVMTTHAPRACRVLSDGWKHREKPCPPPSVHCASDDSALSATPFGSQTGRAAPANFHNELALIYLRMATGAGNSQQARSREGDPHASSSGAGLEQSENGAGEGLLHVAKRHRDCQLQACTGAEGLAEPGAQELIWHEAS